MTGDVHDAASLSVLSLFAAIAGHTTLDTTHGIGNGDSQRRIKNTHSLRATRIQYRLLVLCAHPAYLRHEANYPYLHTGLDRQADYRFATRLAPGACARHNWRDVQVITDTISGSKISRKGLDALMKAVWGRRCPLLQSGPPRPQLESPGAIAR